MSRLSSINLALGLAVIVCILMILSGGRDLSQPNVEYMPDMAYSKAHETFSASPVFRDGVTIQRPPDGSIARGRMPLRFGASKEEAERAGAILENPLDPARPEVLARGADIYASFCQPCHGATGAGDGPVAARGYPPPPALTAERPMTMPDGQVFHIITYGLGNMPSHAAQIRRADRWSVILHLRVLQQRAAQKRARQAETAGGES